MAADVNCGGGVAGNLEIDLFGQNYEFASFVEVRQFLEQERLKWSWLSSGGQNWGSNAWNQISQQYQGLIEQLVRQENSGGALASASSVLSNVAAGGIPFSDSEFGRLIVAIREATDVPAAAFAFAFGRGQISLSEAKAPWQLRAAFAVTFPQGLDFTSLEKRMTEERESFRSSALELSAVLNRERTAREGEWRHDRELFRSLSSRMLRRRRDRWRSTQGEQRDEIEGAVASIKAVEKAYTEAMALKAPVEYWREQAGKHETSAARLLWGLVAFFAIAVVVLGSAFFAAGRIILTTEPAAGHPAAPVALYVVISGGLVSLSTMVFWVGRLLTKLYLSETHLRQDAESRAVMTETYLALIHDGAATDEERKIVLSALFRNTPDGIVKDEGPTEFAGLAALLSSVAAKH